MVLYGRNRRIVFDRVADLYDSVRPSYPGELTGDLVAGAELKSGSRVLEIGPGTGQLTVALASAGLDVVSIEIGRNLLEVAKRNLAGKPNIKLIHGDFDIYDFEPGEFDAIVAATSYHWLNPEFRARKISGILGKKGKLAIIETYHVMGGDTDFFHDSQKCYIRWDPMSREIHSTYTLPPEDRIDALKWEAETFPYFRTMTARLYPLELTYSSSRYATLLNTYSDVLAMNPVNRAGLLRCLKKIIDSRYGGSIRKRYVFELFIAEKKE